MSRRPPRPHALPHVVLRRRGVWCGGGYLKQVRIQLGLRPKTQRSSGHIQPVPVPLVNTSCDLVLLQREGDQKSPFQLPAPTSKAIKGHAGAEPVRNAIARAFLFSSSFFLGVAPALSAARHTTYVTYSSPLDLAYHVQTCSNMTKVAAWLTMALATLGPMPSQNAPTPPVE